MPVMTRTETQLLNDTVFEQLNDPQTVKEAADGIDQFTRRRVREDGIARRVMPYTQCPNDSLDKQYWTDKPVKIFEMEPDAPAAMSVPFGATPVSYYIRGRKYVVTFDRLLSPRFTKDIEELRTYTMDIRQVLSDNAIKDMLAEEDSKFIGAIGTALLGQNTTLPYTGTPMWVTIPGGIRRGPVQDSLKVMPSTPFHIDTAKVLVNNVTIREFLKWGRDEIGGDLSQQLLENGWTKANFMGVEFLITIKRDLVPDNRFYMFSDPKFLGKALYLEDTTFYIKREAWFLEFFAYCVLGASFATVGGLSIVDFI